MDLVDLLVSMVVVNLVLLQTALVVITMDRELKLVQVPVHHIQKSKVVSVMVVMVIYIRLMATVVPVVVDGMEVVELILVLVIMVNQVQVVRVMFSPQIQLNQLDIHQMKHTIYQVQPTLLVVLLLRSLDLKLHQSKH